MKFNRTLYYILIMFLSMFLLIGCTTGAGNISDYTGDENSGRQENTVLPVNEWQLKIEEDQAYSKPEDVAEYIHIYQQLPPNYITKNQAREQGWKSHEGNLWEVTDMKSIGGDVFGNHEGFLPEEKGRVWRECDVNYYGGYRGEERVVYSNDGLIYYTNDHYASFTQIY